MVNPDEQETQVVDINLVEDCAETPKRLPSDMSVGTKRALFQDGQSPSSAARTPSPSTASSAMPPNVFVVGVVGEESRAPGEPLDVDSYLDKKPDPAAPPAVAQDSAAEQAPEKACTKVV